MASSLMFLQAGAVAGLTYNLLTYPVDTIKSNIQAGMPLKEALRNSFMLSKAVGYKVVMLRALFGNSSAFLAYETAQKYICRYQNTI